MSRLRETKKSRYEVGQVWTYKTRPGEEESTFTIVKINSHAKMGNIIHLFLEGVRIRNPMQEEGFSDLIPHMPFSEDAVAQSAVKMIRKVTKLPEFEEGYDVWKESFDEGEAGVFTTSLAQGLDYLEKSINEDGVSY